MSEQETPLDKSPTPLNDDLCTLDQVFVDTSKRRRKIVDKLEEAVLSLELMHKDKEPREKEVDLQLVNTLLGALKDEESGVFRRASTKLKLAEQQTTSNHSKAVVDLLAKISSGRTTLTPASLSTGLPKDNESDLGEAFRRANLDPAPTTELKIDPNDLSD
ncbi:unnamed protein product [Sphagnum jensenii]|uniref:Uncharacterized protein n=1 Tax=Sphagnum jensenii TaxID=128206 RepID=A0ABP0VI99_9BRYO